jgi:hypothetical protein
MSESDLLTVTHKPVDMWVSASGKPFESEERALQENLIDALRAADPEKKLTISKAVEIGWAFGRADTREIIFTALRRCGLSL